MIHHEGLSLRSFRLPSAVLLCLALAASAVSAQDAALKKLVLDQFPGKTQPGLCLYLGVQEGQTLSEIAAETRLQVQGVVENRELAERLRQSIPAFKEAERLSVVWRRTQHLPYLDNLADLIVADGWGGGDLKSLQLSDLIRVLCPFGVAIVGCDSGLEGTALLAEAQKIKGINAALLDRKGAWIKIVKPFDPRMGEWCGSAPQGNSLVSNDQVVSPSKEVRWINYPMYGAAWDSYGGSGSYGRESLAGGRCFHTEVDYIKPGVSQYYAIARNGFNGVQLWKVPIPEKSSIAASDEKRVYLGEGKDLVARDANTGAILNSYGPGFRGRYTHLMRDKVIVSVYTPLSVFDKETGKVVWSRSNYGQTFSPAYKDGVIFLADRGVEALALEDGKTLWKVNPPELTGSKGAFRSCHFKGNALYVQFDFEDGEKKLSRLVALDPENGKVLWTDTRSRNGALLLAFDDQAWLANEEKVEKDKINYNFTLLDAKTGKEQKSVIVPKGTGCWGPRASGNYILWSRANFLDRKTFETVERFGVRSSCGVGQIPAYGLLYYTPHTCNCYIAMRGVYALSGGSQLPEGRVTPQLIKGTASVAKAPAGDGDWPLYRATGTRANALAGELPAELKKHWSVKLGDSPVMQATGAAGMVFAAVADQHRVSCLDLESGKEKWTFIAEGRVSVAPTYYNGLCLFGDHAGWVYALDAATGRVAWQMQAAPEQKYMSAFGQFESSWPVKSGVLILDDRAYFVAGRCGTMDGGIYLYGADPNTGEIKLTRNFNDDAAWVRAPKTADLLETDGRRLIGWGAGIDTGATPAKPQSKTPPKLLKFGSTWQGPNAILDMLSPMNPAGTYMKSQPSDGKSSGEFISFDKDRTVTSARKFNGKKDADDGQCMLSCKGANEWSVNAEGLHIQALMLAGTHVYAAGRPIFHDSKERSGLCIFSSSDGKLLQKIELEHAPSNDGLSTVGGKVLLATTDGQLNCFGAR